MLYCARAIGSENVEKVRRTFEELQLHAGSFIVSHVKNGRVIRIAFVNEHERIEELLIPEFNFAVFKSAEFCLVASSSRTLCRACTDSMLCVSFSGLINFETVYSLLVEKSIEPPDIRPELLLLELISTIYETDAEYSLERLSDKLIELSKGRRLSPDILVISVTQLRECCTNVYTIVISYTVNSNVFVRYSKGMSEILYIPTEYIDYPHVRKVLEKYDRIAFAKNTALCLRLGMDEVWFSLTKLGQ